MSDLAIPDNVLRDALEAVAPGNVLLATDCDWDMKSPCDDCPFLKTSPFHQGVAQSLPDYGESIAGSSFSHSCHKTDTRPDVDGPRTFQGTTKHCAGALMMLLKTGRGMDLQLPLLQAMEAGKFDVKEMTARAKADDRVFTVPELLTFYATTLGRQIRNRRRKKLRAQKKSERKRRGH